MYSNNLFVYVKTILLQSLLFLIPFDVSEHSDHCASYFRHLQWVFGVFVVNIDRIKLITK